MALVKRSSFAKLRETLQEHPDWRPHVQVLLVRKHQDFLMHMKYGGLVYGNNDGEKQVLPLLHLLPSLKAYHYQESELFNRRSAHQLLHALKTASRLGFLSMTLPYNVIMQISDIASLSCLTSLRIRNSGFYIELDEPNPEPPLPPLSLATLSNLFLEWMDGDLTQPICTWAMPKLENLYVDLDHLFDFWAYSFGESPHAMEVLTPLLDALGPRLRHLSLHGGSSHIEHEVDIKKILLSCPYLTSLAFVAYWRFPDGAYATGRACLERVGLHYGEFVAIQHASPYAEVPQLFAEPREDSAAAATANIAWLSKQRFPRLSSIRILCCQMLNTYVEHSGRSAVVEAKSAGFLDLERRCREEGISVEDCTGKSWVFN